MANSIVKSRDHSYKILDTTNFQGTHSVENNPVHLKYEGTSFTSEDVSSRHFEKKKYTFYIEYSTEKLEMKIPITD